MVPILKKKPGTNMSEANISPSFSKSLFSISCLLKYIFRGIVKKLALVVYTCTYARKVLTCTHAKSTLAKDSGVLLNVSTVFFPQCLSQRSNTLLVLVSRKSYKGVNLIKLI